MNNKKKMYVWFNSDIEKTNKKIIVYYVKSQSKLLDFSDLNFHWEQGRKEKYPICCITFFVLHSITFFLKMKFFNSKTLKKMFPFIIHKKYKNDEQIFCPYHFIKALFKKEIEINIIKIKSVYIKSFTL